MPGARVASGDRVTLRTAEEEDASFLQRAHANPELRYPLGWDVKSRGEIAANLADNIGHDELFIVCLDGEDAAPARPRKTMCNVSGPSLRRRPSIFDQVSVTGSLRRYTGKATAQRRCHSCSITSSGYILIQQCTRRRSRTTTPPEGCWSRSGSPKRGAPGRRRSGMASTRILSRTVSSARSGTTRTDAAASRSTAMIHRRLSVGGIGCFGRG
jgi:hypothetical protein